uniref:Calcineurin-like phosphoesterase domain-containing protein n=1 Tax=Chromera velia CCMP2878 TaxID=1169474 RepID=A0A0G4HXU3_9ALVE|eukprot:Cvel_9338.t1-p1 / transcript=Cvel_9338.t1 / gene=Cvel_9338 / organism=Chromera_velia_CCMP2878 / gene_product=Probable inactive purple acid phosphatase 29, putative / transcript_product=Probable inactive purple acid phosphatase 29, putative / location=Cvel_scaffold536:11566-14696(+) / protein_length=480 / sequence_SO=supercontig / SO=protein_coding / is_pseudo=false
MSHAPFPNARSIRRSWLKKLRSCLRTASTREWCVICAWGLGLFSYVSSVIVFLLFSSHEDDVVKNLLEAHGEKPGVTPSRGCTNEKTELEPAVCTLPFHGDGSFKILQVADTHFGLGAEDECENVGGDPTVPCSSLNTTAFIADVVRLESPDLIVFTGDQIWHPKGPLPRGVSAPTVAREAIKAVTASAVSGGIPFAAVFGNHDEESKLSRRDQMREYKKLPGACVSEGPQTIPGYSNFRIDLSHLDPPSSSSSSPQSLRLPLFFLDNGGNQGFVPDPAGRDVTGFSRAAQNEWLVDQISALRRESRSRTEILQGGALFLHIPTQASGDSSVGVSSVSLPVWFPHMHSLLCYFNEYREATISSGAHREFIFSSWVNSGLGAAALSSGLIRGIFCGHDHINDFCGEWPPRRESAGPKSGWKGSALQLCYGGGCGYGIYGREDVKRRMRVIELTNFGGTAKTWLRFDRDPDLVKRDLHELWR